MAFVGAMHVTQLVAIGLMLTAMVVTVASGRALQVTPPWSAPCAG